MTYYWWLTLISAILCDFSEIIPTLQGTNPTIFCNSSTIPKWFKNGVRLKKRSDENPYYIVFNGVLEEDSGEYTCHGTYNDEHAGNFINTSKLFVGGNTDGNGN